ncbi:MAG: hypothetical protein COX57_10070 [Alphaproteobacteria bacterium CG_4_10_14_0_2_um_filter_63_37]|nr:MAG: hypothetical protein AUJ55_04095 [Proteobacteria bacterium CG1_02_64_396]PJA24127.1 MAG: hypothetical protein COX57_10070 [Alphaproteobacteria bacterium CG_4_10_14_0_2_um_filter_63_37]
MAPTIWIDADACPRPIREILYRAAQRVQIPTVAVANRPPATPDSPLHRSVRVNGGPDAADDHIAEHCQAGDLVITADIPLAARVVERGGWVLDPRGDLLDANNVRERLSLRDFMAQMRDSGMMEGGGPSAFGNADKQNFANALDRLLARLTKP